MFGASSELASVMEFGFNCTTFSRRSPHMVQKSAVDYDSSSGSGPNLCDERRQTASASERVGRRLLPLRHLLHARLLCVLQITTTISLVYRATTSVKRYVFQQLPEPNRACLVGVYAFLIWNNLRDLVYQTPTKSYQSQKPRFCYTYQNLTGRVW